MLSRKITKSQIFDILSEGVVRFFSNKTRNQLLENKAIDKRTLMRLRRKSYKKTVDHDCAKVIFIDESSFAYPNR